jgi:hypothetical protein
MARVYVHVYFIPVKGERYSVLFEISINTQLKRIIHIWVHVSHNLIYPFVQIIISEDYYKYNKKSYIIKM